MTSKKDNYAEPEKEGKSSKKEQPVKKEVKNGNLRKE